MKALAVGLQLDEQRSKSSGVAIEGRPRRQGLSQRLELQTLGKKGKETEESAEYASGGEQSADDFRKVSSLQVEHNISRKQQQQRSSSTLCGTHAQRADLPPSGNRVAAGAGGGNGQQRAQHQLVRQLRLSGRPRDVQDLGSVPVMHVPDGRSRAAGALARKL
ncbi:hypothetical protein EV175_003070 [Coemansia sp. RSA 1933]|nr:hypothetical protein EV175_003070 [Coemansia sp. RSA 1933]